MKLRHRGAVTLHTERFLLRAFTMRDAYAMYENWACDPEVARYMSGKAHGSIAMTRQVLESWCFYDRKRAYHWAIVPNGRKEPIGSVSFVAIDGKTASAEVGYTLSRRYWGQGIATEVLREILRYGTETIGFRSYTAQLFEENARSARVLEKCGFSLAQRIENGAMRNTGEMDTLLIYRLDN